MAGVNPCLYICITKLKLAMASVKIWHLTCTQQNSYSISHLLCTVTTLWLDSDCVDNKCQQSGNWAGNGSVVTSLMYIRFVKDTGFVTFADLKKKRHLWDEYHLKRFRVNKLVSSLEHRIRSQEVTKLKFAELDKLEENRDCAVHYRIMVTYEAWKIGAWDVSLFLFLYHHYIHIHILLYVKNILKWTCITALSML